MISLKIKHTGLKEFIEANNKAIAALDNGDFTEEIAKKSKNRAKYRAPRKSGKLISGIDYKMQGANSFSLECDTVNEQGVSYPEILELGLSRFIPIGTPENPRTIISSSGKIAFLPYMRWAIWRTLQEIDQIFKEKILKYYK